MLDVGGTFMFSNTTVFSVKGGTGLNSAGYGGSGGRVFINGLYADDSYISTYSSQISVSGGKSANCDGTPSTSVNECGGVGTLYNPYEQTLYIGPSTIQTSKRTVIHHYEIKPVTYIGEYALVCSEYSNDLGFYPIEGTDFEINGVITNSYGYTDQIVVTGNTVNILETGSIDGTSVGKILVNSTGQMQINSAGTVAQIGGKAVFHSQGSILYFKGMMQSIISSALSTLVFIAQEISLNSNQASITVEKIGLISYTNIYSEGEIKSSDGGSICNSAQPTSPDDQFQLQPDNIFQCSTYENRKAFQNIDDITK